VYHQLLLLSSIKNAARKGGIYSAWYKLLVFTCLIGYTAAGLAGRLTGSLALTTAAVCSALAQVASF